LLFLNCERGGDQALQGLIFYEDPVPCLVHALMVVVGITWPDGCDLKGRMRVLRHMRRTLRETASGKNCAQGAKHELLVNR